MTSTTRRARIRILALTAAGAFLTITAGCGNGLVSTGAPTGTSTAGTESAPSAVPDSSESATPDASTDSSASSSPESSSSDTTASSPQSSASSDSAGSAGSQTNSSTCKLSDLSVGVRASDGGGAAGSDYVLLTFRNVSSSTCYLRGYAGVSFVGKQNGTQLGHSADRVKTRELSTVKLSVGETEKELLQIANAGNYDAADCAPTTSDGFRVYPPAETKAAYVPFRTQACQTGTVHQLSVYPVGTSG